MKWTNNSQRMDRKGRTQATTDEETNIDEEGERGTVSMRQIERRAWRTQKPFDNKGAHLITKGLGTQKM